MTGFGVYRVEFIGLRSISGGFENMGLTAWRFQLYGL